MGRAGFAAVVFAAAVSGLALLVWPDATGQFFSWGLGPPPLASLVGGLYLASAVTFAAALRTPWPQVRGLLTASLVLTTSALAVTLMHLDVFDFSRWQAWAWVVLFAAAPPFWGVLLAVNRGLLNRPRGPRGVAGVGLLVVGVVLGLAAVGLWIAPAAWEGVLPFEPSPLGGRFLGCWSSFLAVMAAYAGLRPDEVRLSLVALTAFPAAAFLAALRSSADLSPASLRVTYLIVVGAIAIVFGLALGAIRRRR